MTREIDSAEVWRVLAREVGETDARDVDGFAEWLREAIESGGSELRWMPPRRPGFRLYYSRRDGLFVHPYPDYAPYRPERSAEAQRVTALLQAIPGAGRA
jgi:hypothetical protein